MGTTPVKGYLSTKPNSSIRSTKQRSRHLSLAPSPLGVQDDIQTPHFKTRSARSARDDHPLSYFWVQKPRNETLFTHPHPLQSTGQSRFSLAWSLKPLVVRHTHMAGNFQHLSWSEISGAQETDGLPCATRDHFGRNPPVLENSTDSFVSKYI